MYLVGRNSQDGPGPEEYLCGQTEAPAVAGDGTERGAQVPGADNPVVPAHNLRRAWPEGSTDQESDSDGIGDVTGDQDSHQEGKHLEGLIVCG